MRHGKCRGPVSRASYDQTRQCNFAIGNVVVDAFGVQIFTRLIYLHSLDSSTSRQFGDDMVALGVCIRIRGVGDLKCEPS